MARTSGAPNIDSQISRTLSSRSSQIVDFKMPRGSLVIYNTNIVHRAAPIKNRRFERLFFQVEKKELGGEPILINTSFLGEMNDETRYFLGFGAKPEYSVFPETNLWTCRAKHFAWMLRQMGPPLAKTVDPRRILTPKLKITLKRWLRKNASPNLPPEPTLPA
jgi:hypothetical protein